MGVEKESGNGYTSASGDEFASYPLPGLLPDGHVLVLSNRLGLLSHLAPAGVTKWPHLLAQEQFSASEVRVLVPLLEDYPDYCPYEKMLASFTTGQVTEEAVTRARLRLQEAQFAGVWDYEMRPVRNILSHVRFKLRHFRIEVRSILETGYLLKPFAEETRAERNVSQEN